MVYSDDEMKLAVAPCGSSEKNCWGWEGVSIFREFDVGVLIVEVLKDVVQLLLTALPNDEGVVTVSEPDFWVDVLPVVVLMFRTLPWICWLRWVIVVIPWLLLEVVCSYPSLHLNDVSLRHVRSMSWICSGDKAVLVSSVWCLAVV